MSSVNCSFCGKSQHQAEKVIVGPACVGICNECVGLCVEILLEERAHYVRDMFWSDIGVDPSHALGWYL